MWILAGSNITDRIAGELMLHEVLEEADAGGGPQLMPTLLAGEGAQASQGTYKKCFGERLLKKESSFAVGRY